MGDRINNLGFNRADGLLYGYAANANVIVQIDSQGSVFPLGLPTGLPATPTVTPYNAGDVSTDGATMFLQQASNAGTEPLYTVDLTMFTATSQTVMLDPSNVTPQNDSGIVVDWAYNPVDGNLYGGDSTGGQLARLDPTTGIRTDFRVCNAVAPNCSATTLPSTGTGDGYGASWFNAAGRLFLYRNGGGAPTGTIYEIDLGDPSALDHDTFPLIVSIQTGHPNAVGNNDGAACVQDRIGVAKHMTATPDLDSLPKTIEIVYTIENFSASESLSDVSVPEDLTVAFGTHGIDWTFTSITSVPAAFANAGFNGDTDQELVASNQSLAAGATVTITVEIQLLTFANLAADGTYCNQVQVSGEDANGVVFDDLSTAGLDPDPDGNGDPVEAELACLALGQVPLVCHAEPFVVQDDPSQIRRGDQGFLPFSFTDLGPLQSFRINSMGYRNTDGLLYASEIESGSGGELVRLIQIDNNGDITDLGRPAGLPATLNTTQGDVSTDGDKMYLPQSGPAPVGNPPPGSGDLGFLYSVDLTDLPSLPLPAAEATEILPDGATPQSEFGRVGDWAYNLIDGKLYGGDSSPTFRGGGHIARVDPATGQRSDFRVCFAPNPSCTTTVLPNGSGTVFGAAWFNAAGQLFLYENSGTIYEIDLANIDDGNPDTYPVIVATQTGLANVSGNNNDGAACVRNVVGAAKEMTTTPDATDVLPRTVTIRYTFENFSDTEDLSNVTASDDLAAVFGAHGTDWTFTSITSSPTDFANADFDGNVDTELFASDSDLAAGATVTMTVQIELLTLANRDDDGRFCNMVDLIGRDANGVLVGDRSTSGLDPDPDGDGFPIENGPSCLVLGQTPFACQVDGLEYGQAIVVQDALGELYRYDIDNTPALTVTPFSNTAPSQSETGFEVNNIGLRGADGLVYGWADENQQ